MLCLKMLFLNFEIINFVTYSVNLLCINFEIIYVVTRAGHALFLGLRAAPTPRQNLSCWRICALFWP